MMKHWVNISLICLAIFIFIFSLIHIFVNIKGKSLLVRKLEETFNRKTEVGSLSTSFPNNIHIKGIEVKGLLKIEEVFAGGGLFDIFRKRFHLSLLKVIRPVVTIEKGFVESSAESVIPSYGDLGERSFGSEKTSGKNISVDLDPLGLSGGRFLFPAFYLGRLIIYDGTFNFVDRSIGDKGITIKLENVYIKADNLNLISRGHGITSFELKGEIPWREGQNVGKLKSEGWLNFAKKNMEATLRIEDIDGVYLYPYYSQWVDLEKARIESAKLNFTSDIHGFNNDVTANCRLELTDIVRKPRPPEEPGEKAERIADAVLDIFRALDKGKIVLDFAVKTKMDRPVFGLDNIRMAFEDKLTKAAPADKFSVETILTLPTKLLEGTIKGATDISKAMINGTISMGKELKRAVEDKFKREPKETK